MIPESVKYILEKLETHGYEAYVVGGAVRDYYLNKEVNDWDITTDAEPCIIEEFFEKTYSIGRAFGTVVVILDSIPYEITTYRTESHYSDGRRPDRIAYSKDLAEDLSRRDFTMNAMVMTKEGDFIDLFEGKKSLDNKIIYCVGKPELRFKEDYLRVYRYVRFNTQLDFNRNKDIDNVILNMPMNRNISFERIQLELNKILLSKTPSKGIRHLKSLGLLSHILPGIEKSYDFEQHCKFHHLNVFDHSMVVLDSSSNNIINRLAGLLHDIGKPDSFELVDGEGQFHKHHHRSHEMAEYILRRLKYSNHVVNTVLKLIHYHMTLIDVNNKKSVKKFMNKIGSAHLDDFLDLRKADIQGSKTNDDFESIDEMRDAFYEVLNENHPMTIHDLDINGHDLMELGYIGPEISRVKHLLLDHVLLHHDDNNKDRLIELLKSKELI